jgi:hypothetical protein
LLAHPPVRPGRGRTCGLSVGSTVGHRKPGQGLCGMSVANRRQSALACLPASWTDLRLRVHGPWPRARITRGALKGGQACACASTNSNFTSPIPNPEILVNVASAHSNLTQPGDTIRLKFVGARR